MGEPIYHELGDLQPSECVPRCPGGCVAGKCTSPSSCSCYPGWTGPHCTQLCRRGTWGPNCGQRCTCLARGSVGCSETTGACHCKEKWHGTRCHIRTDSTTTVLLPGTTTTTTTTTTTRSHTGELLAILLPASAILLLLLLVAVALTVVICRRRIEKLRKRHSEVRQGVVRLGPPVGNIYQEVDD